MADINIPGVNDKYKTNDLVANLMKLERVPLEREQKNLEAYEFEQSSWRGINQKMTKLRESSRNLYSFDNPFNSKLASSSNETAVTIEAGRNASLDSFQIDVLQPASADRFLSDTLDKGHNVPAGAYTFTVGSKTATINWKGGKIEDFITAVNKRSNGIIKASLIGVSQGSQALLMESLMTGSENNLVFGDTARQFAESIGMLRIAGTQSSVFGTEDNGFSSPPPLSSGQEDMPVLAKSTVSVSDTGISIPPRAGVTIPIPQDIADDSSQTIGFTVWEQTVQDITESYSRRASQPVMPDAGSVQYQGITISNIASETTLPPQTETVSPQDLIPVSTDILIHLTKTDGTEEPLNISGFQPDADGKRRISFSMEKYPNVSGITIRNFNTGKEVTLSPFTASSQKSAAAGYEPVNAVSVAADAKIRYEGITITRPENTIDDVIPDVTLHIHAPTDTPATLKIEPDTETAKDAIISFVGNYNQVIGELNILTQSSPEIISEMTYMDTAEQEEAEKRLGLFRSDFSLTSAKSALQTIMSGVYSADENAAVNSLAQIGISTRAGGFTGFSSSQLRGYLEIDEKKLDAALQNSMPDIKNLFGYDSNGDLIIDTGIAYQTDQRLQAYVQNNGILATKTSALDRKIQTSQNTIKKLETQLADTEAQLKQKYGQMEATLNNLESQQDSISNFSRRQNNSN